MSIASAIFWIVGFALSVIIAPTVETWSWGLPMFFLAISSLWAIPSLFLDQSSKDRFSLLIPALLIVSWIVLRVYTSPVKEFATHDLLLLSMAVSTYITFRAISGNAYAERIVIFGSAALLAATLYVMIQQSYNPTFSLFVKAADPTFLRGFHGHYSYCASYLIPSSLILASFALFGRIHISAKLILLVLAAAGLVAIVMTKSRGGVFAMCIGLAVLLLGCLLWGKKWKKKWFLPVAFAAPLFLIGGGVCFYALIVGVEQSRFLNSNFFDLLDNSTRLYLLGTAMSCILLHPWWGGGSRSYDWESLQTWDIAAYGSLNTKPVYVHNELVQTFTDYGLIGGFFLLLLLFCVIITSFLNISSQSKEENHSSADAWRIGGIAGLIGLLVHSCFEGILRIPSGAILFGLCLVTSTTFTSQSVERRHSFRLRNLITALCALLSCLPLAFYGTKGAMATLSLWQAYYAKEGLQGEAKAEAIGEALKFWPSAQLHDSRGRIYLDQADSKTDSKEKQHFYQLAQKDFQQASIFEPFTPMHWINQGGMLVSMNRYEEALPLFHKAVVIQGKGEAIFHANHYLAQVLVESLYHNSEQSADLPSNLALLKQALFHIDKAYELGRGFHLGIKSFELRESILIAYGKALNDSENYSEALKHYDLANEIQLRGDAAYFAAKMLSELGMIRWIEGRFEDSLKCYLEAEKRIPQLAFSHRISEEKKTALQGQLQTMIQELQAMQIKASESLNF